MVNCAYCALPATGDGRTSAGLLPRAQAQPTERIASAARISPLAYRTDLQPLRAPNGHPIVPMGDVLGTKRVMVLRVYFHDYSATSTYSKAQVEGVFGDLDTLWRNTSYRQDQHQRSGHGYFFQLPSNRSAYIDDFADGDLSNGAKFGKVLFDAIANAPGGLDWTNLDALLV